MTTKEKLSKIKGFGFSGFCLTEPSNPSFKFPFIVLATYINLLKLEQDID